MFQAPYWMVHEPEAGPPRVRHADRAAAEAEARRIAGLAPGRVVHVLETVAAYTAAVAPVAEVALRPAEAEPAEAVVEPSPESFLPRGEYGWRQRQPDDAMPKVFDAVMPDASVVRRCVLATTWAACAWWRDVDGWEAWHGEARAPVPPGTVLDILLRGAKAATTTSLPECLRWKHTGSDSDIVRWRPAR